MKWNVKKTYKNASRKKTSTFFITNSKQTGQKAALLQLITQQ